MYRIKKEICCVIVLAILGSMPVNAKEVLQNENEAWSPLQSLQRTPWRKPTPRQSPWSRLARELNSCPA